MSAPRLDSPLAARYQPAAAHSAESMRTRLAGYREAVAAQARATHEARLRAAYGRRHPQIASTTGRRAALHAPPRSQQSAPLVLPEGAQPAYLAWPALRRRLRGAGL